MKTKSKIIILICAFALIFSLASVSCFAFTPSNERVSFAETLPFEDIGFDITIEYYFLTTDSSWGGLSLSVYSDEVYVNYIDYLGNYTEVYNSYEGGWLDSSYRSVVLSASPYSYPDSDKIIYALDYLLGDAPVNNISNTLTEAIFGSFPPNSAQQFTIDMFSTLLVASLVLLPLLLAIGFLLRCFRL